MSSQTIKGVSIQRRITRKTKMLKGEINGEIVEFPFDESEFADDFTHEDVIEAYEKEGIKIVDWTKNTYFE